MEKRLALGSDKREDMSAAISNHFKLLDLSKIHFLHLFYPIAGKAEFDSLLLVNWLRSAHPEIKLVLSKSDIRLHTLSHHIWDENTGLSMNQWGITEPENGAEVGPAQLDLILVPLLAFDTNGNRIGYGKGFYDRFLQECRSDSLKVGVSFFPPGEAIPVNEFDVPLDLCITPQKVWKFNN